MVKLLIIVFFGAGIYIGIMLAVYALYNKFCPYDEDTDYWGEGDENKGAAMLWPISLPFFLICGAVSGMSKVMDLIRKYQRGGDNDG